MSSAGQRGRIFASFCVRFDVSSSDYSSDCGRLLHQPVIRLSLQPAAVRAMDVCDGRERRALAAPARDRRPRLTMARGRGCFPEEG